MEKIAILGATGRTGLHIIEQVAARGIVPMCLIRNLVKIV